MPIGAMVTLRGDTMYEFLDRLISIALPRVRDFRGVSRRASTAAATTPWSARPADLRRDRLCEGRQDQGHERHHRHDRQGRQRRPRAAQGLRHALPRRRIKHTKPVSIADRTSLKIESKRHGNHSKARQRRTRNRSSSPASTTAASSAVVPARSCASSAYAVCASVRSPSRARFRASSSRAGRIKEFVRGSSRALTPETSSGRRAYGAEVWTYHPKQTFPLVLAETLVERTGDEGE